MVTSNITPFNRPFVFPQPLIGDVIEYNKLLANYRSASSTIQVAYKTVLDDKVDNLVMSCDLYYANLLSNVNNLRVNSSN